MRALYVLRRASGCPESSCRLGWCPRGPMAPDKRQRISLFPLALALCVALTAFVPLLHGQDSEWAKRNAWQRPAEVMDALGVKQGSVVADVGAGGGYVTFHLAVRGGTAGNGDARDSSDWDI